jgi:hypothetical protein
VGAGTDGLYSQELFRDLLVHERKRSERSKQHFFFVALDIKDVLTNTRSDVEIVNAIIKAIAASSREIDIKGWYEVPICIGIIYTDVGVSTLEQILDKIKLTLAKLLDKSMVSRIGITYSIFPEEDGKQWTSDRKNEAVLYPSLPTETLRKKTQLFLKRVLDICASGAGIVALSPVLLAFAFLIKMTSHGPGVFQTGTDRVRWQKVQTVQIQINVRE